MVKTTIKRIFTVAGLGFTLLKGKNCASNLNIYTTSIIISKKWVIRLNVVCTISNTLKVSLTNSFPAVYEKKWQVTSMIKENSGRSKGGIWAVASIDQLLFWPLEWGKWEHNQALFWEVYIWSNRCYCWKERRQWILWAFGWLFFGYNSVRICQIRQLCWHLQTCGEQTGYWMMLGVSYQPKY